MQRRGLLTYAVLACFAELLCGIGLLFPFASLAAPGVGLAHAAGKLDDLTPSPTSTLIVRAVTATACPSGAPGPWVVRTPQPTAMYGSTAATDGIAVYVAGGTADGTVPSDVLRRYNPATNIWTSLAPMPYNSFRANAVYAPNVDRLFVFGGDSLIGGSTYNITRIYNPGTNSWTTGAEMPGGRWGMAAGYYDGKIYLAGGLDGATYKNSIATWAYDPVMDSWDTTRMNMPAGVNTPGFAIINGHLYVAAGLDSDFNPVNTLYDYDIAGNTWATLPPIPTALHAPGSGALGGKLWIFGGGTPDASGRTETNSNVNAKTQAHSPSALNSTYIYDPAANLWTAGPNLNVARTYIAGSVVGNTVVAAGGVDNTMSAIYDTTETNTLTSHCLTVTATSTPVVTSTVVATATPCSIVMLLNEGFESGTLGVFTSTAIITSPITPIPTPGWASVSSNPHSGAYSAFAPDPDRVTDSRLTTINSIMIPAGVTTATLTFQHRFALENFFDGGVLEVSTNNGATWADADANIQQGGYNGTIFVVGCPTPGTPHPFPQGKRVWTGSQTTYRQVRVNLLPYAGTPMKFRFRLGTDCATSGTGWNVDDVAVSYGSGVCPTSTPPIPTGTSTSTGTITPAPSGTNTVVASVTNTTVASATRTNTAISSATHTALPTITGTATVSATNTITLVASGTPGEATKTPLPSTSVPTNIPTIAPTPCTITFTDVPPGHTFYTFIQCLACKGIISGYSDGTFRPNNEITRGQIAKLVSNAAGINDEPGSQVFEDVDPANTFFVWINRLSNRGYMGGYPCGRESEPCGANNLPYFRPVANATRGQLAKIVSNAAGIGGTPTGQFYADVLEDHPFYVWIMRLTQLGAMSGYPCGGAGEPCDESNRPYFRPFNDVTRGQSSKMVANTFFPSCVTQ
jgi:N-acetylneuraminic acid mutarotase